MGKIYYIMGKSATGKDHIYRALLKDETLGLAPLILFTTRPMRRGETDGREYHFIDITFLEKMRAQGCVIEERVYQTVCGPWHYATIDDGSVDLAARSYLSIGTLESFVRLRHYYGRNRVVPLYIETDDGLRLAHALQRERKQKEPNYPELCRRYLADCDDFSEEKIAGAGIKKRIMNNDTLEACIRRVKEEIQQQERGSAL